MKARPFVHLHLHTCYSLLDGACRIADLMKAAAEQGMPAVAMTDHGVLYGAIDFYKAGTASGIKPIIGCEVYVAPGGRHNKATPDDARNHHLVLLATGIEGYFNLMRLVTIAHTEGYYYKPRVDPESLAAHSGGLIALSACLKGEVPSELAHGHMDEAARVAGRYADIFGPGNFFLEIQDHGIPEQRKVNRLLGQLAARNGLKLVATNDVHYLKKEHAAAHEVLLCLQTQTVMSDPKRMRYATDNFYLRTRSEMDELFGEFPGAVDTALDIADRCELSLEFGKTHFPAYRAPAGLTQQEYLVRLAHDGIRRRYGVADPARPRDGRETDIMRRFDDELAVIEKTGFINYFLVVWDFVRFARESGIPVGPGRGSGGGSLVAYALGITDIDPLRYDLIFERFLNPERVSPPDFDIDFCQARRGEVIEYVKNKYGAGNVAQIITFGSLGPKTVIRDVGRVLEVAFAKCDKLSKMIPEDPKMTLEKAVKASPEFAEACEKDADCRRILEYGFVLEGLYRNSGTHAAGVVIGEKPLAEIIPLSHDKDGNLITQYTMEPLGEIGLLKMDFLGLKTLTVIRETVELIRKGRRVEVDLDALSFDDKPAFQLLNRADTVGIFQLESGGMRNLIRRIGIGSIADLIAVIALYRPGPMEMLPLYIDRKTGKSEIGYDHKLLEPILKETYGVMVYQEQVQRAANVLAGYSLGEADILRRAMGKKKPEEMAKQRARFVKGCWDKNRIPKEMAGKIYDAIESFAGYGFNKAHSTGYAIVAYQTAYLKANYPAEFMAALLSSEIGNFDKIPVFMTEADHMGLKLLPPDVNRSGTRFLPEGEGLRYGLAGVKNVGIGAAEAIAADRERGGAFTSLVNLCSRLDGSTVNRKALESLVRAGACDCLGMHRARLFSGIDFAMNRAASAIRDKAMGQSSLFDLLAPGASAPFDEEPPEAAPWHENEMLAGERELLGVYMSGHPLTKYAAILRSYRQAATVGLEGLADRSTVRLAGIASRVAKKLMKENQKNWAIMELEDLEGSVEVLVFPEAYEKYGGLVQQDSALLVCGEIARRDDRPKVVALEIYPLGDAPKFFAEEFHIHVPVAHADGGDLEKIRAVLLDHPGHAPVRICLIYPSNEKVFIAAGVEYKVLPDGTLSAEIERVLGEGSAYTKVRGQTCLKPQQKRKWQGRNGNGTSS